MKYFFPTWFGFTLTTFGLIIWISYLFYLLNGMLNNQHDRIEAEEVLNEVFTDDVDMS